MNETDSRSSLRRHLLLLTALAALLFLSGNSILPLVDRDEPRFSEAAREMLEQRDWIIPWFNGQYRFDKPPLIYWCQIVCYQALGETPFAARLPSVLFGIGTVLLIYGFGRRLHSPAIGLRAAVMFATCLQTIVHARLAVADLAMIFFVTAACWSGWELIRRNHEASPCPRGVWAAFWLSLGLGFLAKGPIAWLPLAAVWGLTWRRSENWSGRQLHSIPGSLLVLVAIGLWGVPALLLTQGEFFNVGIGKHVVSRSFSVMEGHGSSRLIGYLATLPLYFVTVFASFFPWAIWLVGPLRRQFHSGARDTIDNYLLLQVLLVFAVFTLSRTKLPHYTLPAFPCLALWLARATDRFGTLGAKTFRNTMIGMVCFTMALAWIGLPRLAPHFASTTLFEKARPHLEPAMSFATVDYEEPSIVWEFRSVIDAKLARVPAEQARDWLALQPSATLVGRRATLEPLLNDPPPGCTVVTTTGINVARFKPVELAAIIKRSTKRE